MHKTDYPDREDDNRIHKAYQEEDLAPIPLTG